MPPEVGIHDFADAEGKVMDVARTPALTVNERPYVNGKAG